MTYGAKVSQDGFDVNTAADYQLNYSSEFPLLKIAFSGTVTIADATQDVTIVKHDLGFPPAYWTFETSNYIESWGGVKFTYPGTSQFIVSDSMNLTWLGSTRFAPPGTIVLRYYVFYQDLTQDYTSINLNTAAAAISDSARYGIKVSQVGKDVSSTDLRDFVVNSDSRSPIIHKTGFGTLGGVPFWELTVIHNLGYPPMYFIYADLGGGWQCITTADDTFAVATATTVKIYISYSGDYSFIILKDPMETV